MARRVEVDKEERVDHWVEPVEKKEGQGIEEKRNMGKGERLIAYGLCHRGEHRREWYRKEDFSVGGACDGVVGGMVLLGGKGGRLGYREG